MDQSFQGPGKHKGLNHIEGPLPTHGRHRSGASADSKPSAGSANHVLHDAQFSGIKGAGFSQYPKLGSEALDQTYKKARGI